MTDGLDDDGNIDGDEIDDLVSQLKDSSSTVNQTAFERVELSNDNLEEFVLKSSGEVIQDSLEILGNVKDYTANAPDARETTSLAELIKAASSAIDTLNKVLIQNKRSDSQKEIKQLEIEARKGIAMADNQTKILLSREDIMDKLLKDSNAIDITEDT
jgi:hypothetical protein